MAYPSLPVISSFYCAPQFVNLQIDTDKGVTYDVGSNVVFRVNKATFTLHKRCLLCDAGGNPIVTLYKKDGRWRVFKGESNDASEMLFSIKNSSTNKRGDTKLEVFLAKNKDESICDFRVHVSYDKSSCYVYCGESSIVLAEVNNNVGFKLLVHPYFDHAFISTLVIIIDKMKIADGKLSPKLSVEVSLLGGLFGVGG